MPFRFTLRTVLLFDEQSPLPEPTTALVKGTGLPCLPLLSSCRKRDKRHAIEKEH
jgi:hypothetical protein